VRNKQLAAAVAALREHVELDHVDTHRECGRRSSRACSRRRWRRRPCARRGSALTSRAPVGPAVLIALAASEDARGAARAGLAGTAIDRPGSCGEAGVSGDAHLATSEAHDLEQLGVARLADRAPRIDSGGEAALRLPDISDAGQRTLVEQRVTTLRAPSARRRRRSAAGSSKRSPRMSGPRQASRGSVRARRSLSSSSVGPPNCTTSRPAQRTTARRGSPPGARVAHFVDRPGAGHAEVRVEHEIPLEAHEEVLSIGLDCSHGALCEQLRQRSSRGGAAAYGSPREPGL